MKEIPNYPNYFVTKDGRVWSNKTNRFLFTSLIRRYTQVVLCKQGKPFCRRVHRLMLEAFVGKCPKGMEACHNDGNPLNNNLANLRWGTRRENQMDRKIHGTFIFLYGEEHPMAKLTNDQVREIRSLYERGYYQHGIGKIFFVSKQTVSQIVQTKTWKHIK